MLDRYSFCIVAAFGFAAFLNPLTQTPLVGQDEAPGEAVPALAPAPAPVAEPAPAPKEEPASAESNQASAEQAQKLFDELFGGELKRVGATSDHKDDVELAATLLEAAETSTDQPTLLKLLCTHAIQLGTKHSSGYPIAEKAIQLLGKHLPANQQVDSLKQLVTLRRQQYLRSKPDQRTEAGISLINSMLEWGSALESTEQFSEAIAAFRQADSVAGQVRWEGRSQIKQRIIDVKALQRTATQIETAKARLAANPKDQAAAAELVQIYIVELDSPEKALQHAELITDVEMQKNVLLAATPVEQLEEQDANTLGKWYESLIAPTQSSAVRVRLLTRAVNAYDRFLALHESKDLLRTKVELVRMRLGQKLDSLAKALPKTSSKTAGKSSGGWIELLKLSENVIYPEDEWKRDATGLSFNSRGGGWAMFPVTTDQSYDLQFKFTPIGTEARYFSIGIPIGPSGVNLYIYPNARGYADGFSYVDGKRAQDDDNPTRFQGGFTLGKTYLLEIKVLVKGESTAFSLAVNGKPVSKWAGSVDNVRRRYDPVSKSRYGRDSAKSFIVNPYRTQLTIHSVRVRATGGKLAKVSTDPATQTASSDRGGPPQSAAEKQQSEQLRGRLNDVRRQWPNMNTAGRRSVLNDLQRNFSRLNVQQQSYVLYTLRKLDGDEPRSVYKSLYSQKKPGARAGD